MNEPLLILRRDRLGADTRRFAEADAPARAPLAAPQAPATIRTRWPARIAP